MLRLEVLSGEDAGTIVESDADLVRLGRAASSELTLSAVHVSGEHASLVFVGDGYVLRDHHATNGTRVERGGQCFDLAEAPGREFVLLSGDTIVLGEEAEAIRIRFDTDDEEDSARIVSMRSAEELGAVEQKVGADHELLQGLYEAQKCISAAEGISEVMGAVASQVFRFLPRATHVTVALREQDERGKSRRSSRYVPIRTAVREGLPSGESIPITRSVFRKVVEARAAVLAADARRDVGETASLMAAQILSTLGVPLWQGEDIAGVLQVDNRGASGIFREPDLDILAVLAQAASQAFAHARLVQRLRVAEERQRTENVYLKRREESRRVDGILGDSQVMKELFAKLEKVVDTRVTILIEGETGTGKELVASAAHYRSCRRDKLFVAQNCAAMPANLLESELFGHKKGAFTGATEDKKGLFELADEGTLFLDEVGEMPLALQAKLLRVLQEGEIRPVGASRTKRVEVRIVAATNRDLEKEVAEGRFREDLFYRLKVFPLQLPPLRLRRDDIPLLANHFLGRYAAEFGRSLGGFSQEALELLTGYAWPGNVRELQNEVQRLVIQVDDQEFAQAHHLSPRILQSKSTVARVRPAKGTLKQMVVQVEKQLLREALAEHGNNKSATAKTLGITREGLHKKLKGYGMA
ncbi:MAG: GAF domain-containing protein [Deltaproteobacteria bacterium]|nr:GAF domain-containing protein [Deltaproteobacteria bacterium]